MRDWRLIALDLDGTLLDAAGRISEENRKWIRFAREAGIEVTIATGRPTRLMYSFFQELQLTAPYVVANGSEVWTAAGQLLERHTLQHEDVSFMHLLAVEHGARYWSSVVDHVFAPGTFPDAVEDYQWLKFGFHSEDPGIIRLIWDKLNNRGNLEVTSSGPTNIEVNPYGISKATGLKTVCGFLGIDRAQVVVMGDSLNDISMMRWAGLGVAMGNAHDAVKQCAGGITQSHWQHGVARAIENLIKPNSDAPQIMDGNLE